MKVGVVGATGVVGQTLFSILEERNFPVSELVPLASARSRDLTVHFRGHDWPVREAIPDAFDGLDVVFFAATGTLSRTLAPEAARRGVLVIDKSSTWRMDPQVPLVVPEVNPLTRRPASNIIACPNCTTTPLVMALQALRSLRQILRVVVTSFQSVSGTGRDAVDELELQLASPQGEPPPHIYHHPIAHNVLPYCETFTEGGYTTEELKLRDESRKILSLPDLLVTMTCCRVPVRVGHSLSVLVELDSPLNPAEARASLASFPGIRVKDNVDQWEVPTPRLDAGGDDVMVGRIRSDLSSPSGVWMWLVSDNLRKGAALNAVQIAEQVLLGR